jgi:hypothetical protein
MLRIYAGHHYRHWMYRSRNQRPPVMTSRPSCHWTAPRQSRKVLDGVINEYHRAV